MVANKSEGAGRFFADVRGIERLANLLLRGRSWPKKVTAWSLFHTPVTAGS
jgi:hypothetical protein